MDIIIRPTRVEKANLGEHLMRNEDDVKRIMTVEAMPNRPVEVSEEDNSPVDPLEYFAISKSNTADKALKPAFRLLNSDELITNKNAYRFSKYTLFGWAKERRLCHSTCDAAQRRHQIVPKQQVFRFTFYRSQYKYKVQVQMAYSS